MNRRELLRFLTRFGLSAGAMLAIAGCQSSSDFAWNGEGSGPPPAPPAVPGNPFIPNPNSVPPGNSTGGLTVTDSFMQSSASSKVDIVWMVDSSGSMSNNQNALRANASTFTDRLVASSVDFKIMVITSDASDDSMLKPRCGEHSGSVITSSNASDFGDCAVVGQSGSGHEEGLESVRRSIDSTYPQGPWNANASPAPLNSGFLRSDADLQVIYVSDEENQVEPSTWSGQAGVSAADVTQLRQEMAQDLSDDGRPFDSKYSFIPFVANHVSFLKSLKSGVHKVRAHAVVTTVIDDANADECYHKTSTEEIGQEYVATANLMGGSVSDVCGNWASTLDILGLQAAGLEKCFALSKVPTDTSSISGTVNGASASLSYVPTGNQVCFNSVPEAGASISVTYH